MQIFGYSNVSFCHSLFFQAGEDKMFQKFAQFDDLGCPGRIGGLLNWYWPTGWMDGWLVGMTLCRHLKIISLSATIGPAIEKQAKLKIGFERKNAQLYLNMQAGEVWQRGGGFKSCFGNVQIDGTLFKNKNTEAAQKCPIVFEHAGRGGSWQRLRFRVFALERLMLWKWEAALQFTEVAEPFAWTDQKSL